MLSEAFSDVEIDVASDRAVSVAKAPGNHFERYTILSQKSHVRVSEGVRRQTAAYDFFGVLTEILSINVITNIIAVRIRKKQLRALAGDGCNVPLPADNFEAALV